MCLQDQGIDDNDGVVNRVDGGFVRGQGIDDASEESETRTDASRIQGRQRRLRRRNDWTGELATTAEASTEEYDPEVSTTATEASAEEAEEKTRLSERL